jgi:hypothetical protein
MRFAGSFASAGDSLGLEIEEAMRKPSKRVLPVMPAKTCSLAL